MREAIMATNLIRAFLIYAEEDYKFRDLLLSQAKASALAVEFAEMPTKQPWVERWKGVCRTRVFECDGAIVLVSKRTKQGTGVKWELECVVNSGIPVLGVYVEKCERSAVQDEIDDTQVIEWNWKDIATFIQSLQKPMHHKGAK